MISKLMKILVKMAIPGILHGDPCEVMESGILHGDPCEVMESGILHDDPCEVMEK
jgi:Fe2+ transport system protein FeoA